MRPYEFYCRVFQKIVVLGQLFWSWKEPRLIKGPDSVMELPALCKSLGLKRMLLVTDPNLAKLGLPTPLLQGLAGAGILCAVYDQTSADPATENIEDALQLYRENKCEAVIAFGGGSPMDCAKMVGYRIAYPHTPLRKIHGIQPVRLRVPPRLFAVPTTAGTGSETTLAAVVSNSDSHKKYSVLSPLLRPKCAVLDPALTAGLPPHITAATGMDALTHAVEAYIGQSNTKWTKEKALNAVRLIFQYLEPAYRDGGNLEARENMLQASCDAGIAFTRAYVGYAHGIAHALGGLYGIPHGLGCAVVLPHVLAFYGGTVHKRLADLAGAAGISPDAATFVQAIRDMNARMGLPAGFDCIREDDVPVIAAQALKESNPLYPVPKIMNQGQCEALVQGLMLGRH